MIICSIIMAIGYATHMLLGMIGNNCFPKTHQNRALFFLERRTMFLSCHDMHVMQPKFGMIFHMYLTMILIQYHTHVHYSVQIHMLIAKVMKWYDDVMILYGVV